MKDTCLDRINVLKVLSHASWKINKQTLVNLYKSLVLIDYSSYLFDTLSDSNKKSLQIIQNKSLRTIFNIKNPEHISTVELHELANIETIESRANHLNKTYITKNFHNGNPLVHKLIDEFELFKNLTHSNKHPTIFDKWLEKDILDEFINKDDFGNQTLATFQWLTKKKQSKQTILLHSNALTYLEAFNCNQTRNEKMK